MTERAAPGRVLNLGFGDKNRVGFGGVLNPSASMGVIAGNLNQSIGNILLAATGEEPTVGAVVPSTRAYFGGVYTDPAANIQRAGFRAIFDAKSGAAPGTGVVSRSIGEVLLNSQGSKPSRGFLGSIGRVGSASNRTPATSIVAFLTQSLPVGSFLVAIIAFDRPTATTEVDFVASQLGDTWFEAGSRLGSTFGISVFVSRVDLEYAESVTVGFSDASGVVSVTRKLVALHSFSANYGLIVEGSGGLTGTGVGVPPLDLSGLLDRRRVYLRASVKEGPNNALDFTPSSTWDLTIQPVNLNATTDNGSDALLLRGEFDLSAGTGNTSDPSWATPSGTSENVIVAFTENAEAAATAGVLSSSIGEIFLRTEASLVDPTPAQTFPKSRSAPGRVLHLAEAASIDFAGFGSIISDRAVSDGVTAIEISLDASIGEITLSTAAVDYKWTGGALDQSIGEITLSATAGGVVEGDLDVPMGAITLASNSSDVPGVGGRVDRTIGAIRLDAAGALSAPIQGAALNQSIGEVTLNATGKVLIQGGLSKNIGEITLTTATGAVYPSPDQVLSGVRYGPTGTEYTGTASPTGSVTYIRRRN